MASDRQPEAVLQASIGACSHCLLHRSRDSQAWGGSPTTTAAGRRTGRLKQRCRWDRWRLPTRYSTQRDGSCRGLWAISAVRVHQAALETWLQVVGDFLWQERRFHLPSSGLPADAIVDHPGVWEGDGSLMSGLTLLQQAEAQCSTRWLADC